MLCEEEDESSSSIKLCMCKGTGLYETNTGDAGRTDMKSDWSGEDWCARVLEPTFRRLLRRRTILP